jgi:N-acetylglucosamine-6-phosphate deacetylase
VRHPPPLQRQSGTVLAPGGWVRGVVEFSSRISAIRGESVGAPAAGEDLIVPGFVDLHAHGAAGADVMDGEHAVQTISRFHARRGTTSWLATTVTAGAAGLTRALRGIRRAMDAHAAGCARVLGVHLEGPYIHSSKLGAQPPAARPADIDELRHLHAVAPIRVLTLAPELAGHLDFVRELDALGIAAQCGHSAGSYEEGVAALSAGMKGFTHLFNAMTPLHHREPGMVGAALAHATYAEIIPDLIHVHAGAMRAALRCIPCLYAVSDSTAATGMPDGEYTLGAQRVHKCMGGVRLADGTLAGSTLTMDQALRNLVAIGLPVSDACRRVSTLPAQYIGEAERGRIAVGAWADMVVLGADLRPKAVYAEGVAVDQLDV